MRLLLATITAFASVNGLIGQVPTRISEVGTFRETGTDGSSSYPIFEYDGKLVLGDLSLEDYRAALNVVTPRLEATEQITTVSAVTTSQQLPFLSELGVEDGANLIVFTCLTNCLQTRQFPGGSGHLFIFKRIAGTLQLRIALRMTG